MIFPILLIGNKFGETYYITQKRYKHTLTINVRHRKLTFRPSGQNITVSELTVNRPFNDAVIIYPRCRAYFYNGI